MNSNVEESATVEGNGGPWAPGQDVTDRLAAGHVAPYRTILADKLGYLYRAEANCGFTSWWEVESDWAWGPDLYGRLHTYAPIYVATPEQIRAAGIEVPS